MVSGDEFAFLPHSAQIMASMARACPVGKALVSTPFGKANEFYRIRQTASRQVHPKPKEEKQETGHFERYTMHWSQHPHKDEATWAGNS